MQLEMKIIGKIIAEPKELITNCKNKKEW